MTRTDDKRLLPSIASWIGLPSFSENWSGVDAILPLLEQMRQEGAVVLFKLDGERTNRPYTAVISGTILGENFLRIDASSLEEALARIIVHYAQLRWEFPDEDFRTDAS